DAAGGHGVADVADGGARGFVLVVAGVLASHAVDGARGDRTAGRQQHVDGGGERRGGGGDGVFVDVALAVLIPQPHRHADAANAEVVLRGVGAAVVADRLGPQDADVAGRGQEVVAVLQRVQPTGG